MNGIIYRYKQLKREKKMKKHEITINGTFMGIYEGKDKNEALDAMARDAGYASYEAITSAYDDDNELYPHIEDTIEITV